MKQTLQKNSQGFTMIEMMVVVLIIAMIATISIIQFRRGEKTKRVAIAADTVISALRNAQNATLTGKKTSNANANCRVPQYYYITFSYLNNFTLSAMNNCSIVDSIETYTLPASTRIKLGSLLLNGSAATTNMTVIFYPPFGVMKGNSDNGANNTFTSENITVEFKDGSISKSITIDGVSGRIGE